MRVVDPRIEHGHAHILAGHAEVLHRGRANVWHGLGRRITDIELIVDDRPDRQDARLRGQRGEARSWNRESHRVVRFADACQFATAERSCRS